MKRTLVSALLTSFVLAITLATATRSNAQQPPEATAGKSETKAQKARGAADSDPNIKVQRGAQTTEPPAPPQKGGQKTRGALCLLTVDNWTPWLIDVYIDGVFEGTVAPWGDGSIFTPDNPVLYARSGASFWGPTRARCVNSTYRWKLNP
jgi:hypothetical protein